MARASHIAPNRHAAHPFDLKYGTDTAGYLSPDQLCNGNTSDSASNGYSAVAPSVFREAYRRWRESLPASASHVETYTFVDVGAGKGRALLLASQLCFRKAIGVELNADLARTAQQNVARWNRVARPQTEIRVVIDDATNFRWPRPPLLIFLNNPFDCAMIEQMSHKLAAVAARGPSLLDLLYVNPGCADILNNQAIFKSIWDAQIEMDEPDRKADPYGAIGDRVAAFRLASF